jgi:hypothetical protein
MKINFQQSYAHSINARYKDYLLIPNADLGFSKVPSILASELSPDYHGVSKVLRTKGTIYSSIKNILQYTHFCYADEFFMFKCDP